MNFISRESDIPLYKQICDDIIQKINNRELKPGDRIPSEIELAATYNVSRMTVRQALNDMLRERVLLRRRGYGTFVAEKMVERTFHPNVITGFFDEFSENGELVSVVVENTLVFPPKSIYKMMNLDERTLTVKLTRVRFLDGQPLVLDESYIDKSAWEQVKDTDFSRISLYAFLAEVLGEKPVSADLDIQAATASQAVAGYLKIAQGAPILKAFMANRYEDGRVLHVGRLYCPDYMGLKFTIGGK